MVGTATGLGLGERGHSVVFCDIVPERVALLRERGFAAICPEALPTVKADVYLISVPTPTVEGQVDLAYLAAASEALGESLAAHPGLPLVAVRSTVPPGTTETVVIPALERSSGRSAAEDFGVCMNPEFLRAATAREDFLQPKVIVIGALDENSDRALRALYAPWSDVPTVSMSIRTAEATKYVANLFNATKISFFNEMHRVLSALGADADVAATTAARGAEGLTNPLYGTRGGAPYGGVCLPKDTRGFLGHADGLGLGDLVPLLRATIQINEELMAGGREPLATPPVTPLFHEEIGQANGLGAASSLIERQDLVAGSDHL